MFFTTHLYPSVDFPIEFLCCGTHISARPGVRASDAAGQKAALLAKEIAMSVAAYLSSNKSNAFDSRLGRVFAAFGRRCIDVFEAIAEARMHRAMIEAELYLKRYKHSSKNDDDLSVLR